MQIFSTIQKVFRERISRVIMGVSAPIFFALYLLVPTWIVPGNTLSFELSKITSANYLLLAMLASLTGLLLTLEFFAFRRSRAYGVQTVSEGSTGLVASIVAGVLATASCGCGIGILLGVLGFSGATLFVIENQAIVIFAMLGVILVGLYFSMRRAAGICATCHL